MIGYELNSYKERWVTDTVRRAVETVAHKIVDTARVERRAMRQVGQYLARDAGNKNNRRHITHLIYREINASLTLYRREQAGHLADLTSNDEDGQAVEYEPQDVLANVNSGNLELKETITLLAKDDRRRKMILTEWMNGNMDETNISSILADTLGGQARSHCRFVQRFRIECRAELTALAL